MTDRTTESKEEFIRNFLARMHEINSRSIELTGSLAKFNIQSIMTLGNATAPKLVRLPTKSIDRLRALITGEDGE